MGTRVLRWFAIAAMVWLGVARANAPDVVPVPAPEDGFDYVQQRKAAAYADVLARYDSALQAEPGGVTIAVARCEFIGYFIYAETGDWADAALDDYERCTEALAAEHADDPAALLFGLDQVWGDELTTQGEALLGQASDWPDPLRGKLLASLSLGYSMTNEQRSGELALEAVTLGDLSRVAAAVDYLATRRRFDDASTMLRMAPVASSDWEARQRIESALSLPDSQAGLREWQRHTDAGMDLGATLAARVQLRAGDIAAARQLLLDIDDTLVPRQLAFELAMADGDYPAAARTVDLVSMDDFGQDLARFATLAIAAPITLLTAPSMMAGLAISLLVLAAMALAPGLLLVPVHYRGVVRRLKGKPATPLFERAGLWHAWYALALFLCIPLAVSLLVEPEATVRMLDDDALPAAPQLWRMMMWGTVAAFVCVLPAFRGWGRRQLIGDRATLLAAWQVLLAWGVLIGIGALVALSNANLGGAETIQTRTVDALVSGANDAYGPAVSLLLVALLVPVFEELVFRGLVLGGLSRHIGFVWANLLQAALFAVMHDDPPRLVLYFAMGLLAGWLVKRTGALGPAIALHGLNNLLAFVVRS